MALIQTVLTVIVVLIVLYFVINWLFGGSSQLTRMANGNEKQTILASTLKNNNNSSNYTYSTWFYVNDWNYRFGEPKVLLGRLDTDKNPSPSIVLDAMENNITISVSCYQHSGNSEGFDTLGGSASLLCGNDDSILASKASIGCINSIWQQNGCTPNLVTTADPTILMDSNTKRQLPLYTSTLAAFKAVMPQVAQNKQVCYPPASGSAVSGSAVGGSASAGNSVTHQCNVKNFPLQKWVNLIISAYGRTLDVYIDGKLVRTCILPGVAKVDAKSNITITPNGGFNGWTSNFMYWDKSTNPQEAYNIYKNGFGGSLLGNLFNKYRIKFAFMTDNKEVSSIEI